MKDRLRTKTTVDHSDRLRSIPNTRYSRDRTIFLQFLHIGDRYLVQAWGTEFQETGGGRYSGRVLIEPKVLQAAADDLRATWQAKLIEYCEPDRRPTHRPFVDDWNVPAMYLNDVGLALARAGHDLFTLLFLNGDADLDKVTKLMVSAMRASEQIVTVESDHLFVPWNMLYVPLTDQESPWDDNYKWSPKGFWGYRNILEHNFSWCSTFDSRMAVQRPQPTVGLNVDDRLDSESDHPPYVKPMIKFFSKHTTTIVRTRKAELAAALQSPNFPDDIVLFCCHGTVGTSDDRACLVLGDGEEIYSTQVLAWLPKDTLLPTRPLVFVAACQGGQLHSVFYPVFGKHLLDRGARTLIGPQIDVPRTFAKEYATRLFTAFLQPHTRLGDAMRELTRRFMDDHHNPLGLIFSLYRGIDVHLSLPPAP